MIVHLQHGAHTTREDGMCVNEAMAYIAGEPHSDRPECVSPVIAKFLMLWNDTLPTDAERDRLLKPLIVVVLHTRTTPADEETRAWLATDWLVRECAPAWLDAAALTDHATRLRALPALTSAEITVAVQEAIDAARAAAWAAAWAAARAAARAAAWDAARAAAGAAALDAAWAAARDVLRPTVERLQGGAQQLVRRMAAVGVRREGAVLTDRLAVVCR